MDPMVARFVGYFSSASIVVVIQYIRAISGSVFDGVGAGAYDVSVGEWGR